MSVVDEIKERLDIAEVIGRYVHLQKAGRNLKGLCPFHSEKTPSFFVFPEGQGWHCFGCNRGGDLFTFVMEREGWDFRTALEELARQAGVELRPRTPTEVQAAAEGDRLRAALEAAAGYYHTLLLTAPQAALARDYLKRRGFVPETITHFQLGYSLSSWDALRTELFGQGFTVEEMVKAGLLVEKEGGGTYDRFRNRLMIPIYDRQGRIVAFGSRALAPEDQPKYMNSPQTPLFDKSRVLFGLHHATQAIRQADMAVIVEGYMDVMIAHQAGYANVVAPMGTALTESHFKQLQQISHKMVFALDPDIAGIQAIWRAWQTARESLNRALTKTFPVRGRELIQEFIPVEILVTFLPDGLDPDELILQSPEKWAALIKSSLTIYDAYLNSLLQDADLRQAGVQGKILDQILPLVLEMDPAYQEAFLLSVQTKVGIEAKVLRDRVRASKIAQRASTRAQQQENIRHREETDLELYAIRTILHHPGIVGTVNSKLIAAGFEPISSHDFSSVSNQLILEACYETFENPDLQLDSLLPYDLAEQIKKWEIEQMPGQTEPQWEYDLLRTILRLRERQLRAMLQQLQGLVAEAQAEGDLKATRYAATLKALHQTLNQVQQALGRRK